MKAEVRTLRDAKDETGGTHGGAGDIAAAAEYERCPRAFEQAAGNGQSDAVQGRHGCGNGEGGVAFCGLTRGILITFEKFRLTTRGIGFRAQHGSGSAFS